MKILVDTDQQGLARKSANPNWAWLVETHDLDEAWRVIYNARATGLYEPFYIVMDGFTQIADSEFWFEGIADGSFIVVRKTGIYPGDTLPYGAYGPAEFAEFRARVERVVAAYRAAFADAERRLSRHTYQQESYISMLVATGVYTDAVEALAARGFSPDDIDLAQSGLVALAESVLG